jgi:ADP-ribosylarginine hydrolase
MSSSLKHKFKAIMLLHALGDTIGFKNGEWEFNYITNDVSYKTTLEIVFQFISIGGFSGIDLNGWNVSDDTLFHYGTGMALLELKDDEIDLKDKKINNNFKNIYMKHMAGILDKIVKDQKELEDKEPTIENFAMYKFRGVGKKTAESILNWEKNINPSLNLSGGNGCAMKFLCVGMLFYKPEDLDKLILLTIELGKLTHPSPIGYLGGLTSAYFTHLALNSIPLESWPELLIKLVDSERVAKYIDKDNYDVIVAYKRFISLWKKYMELRFKDGKLLRTASHRNLIFRTKFFYDFSVNYDVINDVEDNSNDNPSIMSIIGSSGVTSMLMVYDALVDAEDSWEKLIYYAMLHVGDSDTIGAIAGGLFGALYGYELVPPRMINAIEYKEKIYELAKKIYEKVV